MRAIGVGLGEWMDLDWDERQGARTVVRTHVDTITDWGVVDQANSAEILVDE